MSQTLPNTAPWDQAFLPPAPAWDGASKALLRDASDPWVTAFEADPGRDFADSGPPRDSGASGLITTCDDHASDLDGDGHCGDFDCDEADPSIHADAADAAGDGIDSNCDGAD